MGGGGNEERGEGTGEGREENRICNGGGDSIGGTYADYVLRCGADRGEWRGARGGEGERRGGRKRVADSSGDAAEGSSGEETDGCRWVAETSEKLMALVERRVGQVNEAEVASAAEARPTHGSCEVGENERGETDERWREEQGQRIGQPRRGEASREAVEGLSVLSEPLVVERCRERYKANVARCLGEIAKGESYELCLTTRLESESQPSDPLGAYLRLRERNPAPFAAWMCMGEISQYSISEGREEELEEQEAVGVEKEPKGGGKEENKSQVQQHNHPAVLRAPFALCCSSPERFLRGDRQGMLWAKPIKGTVRRGVTEEEDERLKRELMCSDKDRAENLMIVDLLRNDLGRVSTVGSVHVPSLMAVESYATVHQLVSTIAAQSRPDLSPLACIRAAFPGGSMTGAPKIRSMEILDEIEGSARGPYSGALGFVSFSGTFDLNIVIRTAVMGGEMGDGLEGEKRAGEDGEAEEGVPTATCRLDLQNRAGATLLSGASSASSASKALSCSSATQFLGSSLLLHSLGGEGAWSGQASSASGARRSCSTLVHAMAAAVLPKNSPVVSPGWLHDNLSKVKVLDASWYMPAEKRQPFEEFQHGRIPGAIFFDIDAIADPTTDLPHMLPTESAFSAAASALGLSSSDSIVVYDGKGIFSAARAWWMFRAFGQPRVAVLDGGLPAWRAAGYPVEAETSDKAAGRHKAAATAIKDSYSTKAASNRLLTFNAKLQPNLILSVDQVKANIENKVYQLSDARSAGRFKGIDPEPRAGVRGGSIPGSFNVPFPEVLTPQGQLKPASDLTQAFKSAGVNIEDPKQPLAASCGTGVTACVLALALARLGRWDVPVYDGSWTEWGSLQDTPVVKAE
ncbi:unnamed protein product [Closterium sp. Yama58-4]|nr:unnamed protein product [Closterium sp. Yama58-4]